MIVDTAPAFAALLPHGGRLLGLDLGTRTIGIASCDAGWSYATPGATIRRAPKFAADRAALAALVARDRVAGIVLGLPLNLDGSAGPRVQATKAFARNIEGLGPPILLWDERWSTQAVERQMIAQDMSRAKRAERIDSMAAAHILQGAIDALAAVPALPSPALPSIDAAGRAD